MGVPLVVMERGGGCMRVVGGGREFCEIVRECCRIWGVV